MWQGIYIAIVGGLVHLALIPLAGPIFRFVGHEPLVQQYEITYFQVLCLGATPAIASQANAASFISIRKITIILLRFVAVYSLFDTLNIIFASAIKGAGDTRFVMFMIAIVSSLVLVIPSYIALVLLHAGIYTGWTIASVYISILGLIFLFRFLGGKWKSMRVIELTRK